MNYWKWNGERWQVIICDLQYMKCESHIPLSSDTVHSASNYSWTNPWIDASSPLCWLELFLWGVLKVHCSSAEFVLSVSLVWICYYIIAWKVLKNKVNENVHIIPVGTKIYYICSLWLSAVLQCNCAIKKFINNYPSVTMSFSSVTV